MVAAFAFPSPQPAAADDYPSHPITMIVPYPAGGGVDFMGRLVAQNLSVSLGQQVIVENRGGAGGMIGTRDLAKATPDGYTIGMMLTGISLGANTGYDINKDFSPIGIVASTPIIVDANPALPAKSLAEVIALAKKEPGKLSAGTPPAPTHQLLRRKIVQSDGRRRYYDCRLQRHRSADQPIYSAITCRSASILSRRR